MPWLLVDVLSITKLLTPVSASGSGSLVLSGRLSILGVLLAAVAVVSVVCADGTWPSRVHPVVPANTFLHLWCVEGEG